MPETLTESFCERCGTRYTFEAAAPKGRRLGRIKVLSKGLVNFVTNDDSSLDEAFADARSDQQRELTSHQLEAFHKTFQFCMSCRQYTCGNCWNEAEGRCLSCAPHLGQGILEAPFPDLAAAAILVPPPSGQNGHGEPIALDVPAWPTIDLPSEDDARDLTLPPAELSWADPPTSAADAETAAAADAEADVEAGAIAESEAVAAAAVATEAEAADAEAVEAAAPMQPDEIDDDVAQAVADAERARRAAKAAAAAAVAAAALPTPVQEDADHDLPAAASVRTVEGPAPIISLSAAALAADEAVEGLRRAGFEAEPETTPLAEPVVAEPETSVPAEPVSVAPETAPAAEEFAAEPEVAEPVPPIAAAPAHPEPTPAAPPSPQRDDRVEAPVWQIVAPEAVEPPPVVPTPIPQPLEPPRPSAAAAPSNGAGQGAPGPAPQWPTPTTTPPPQWPMPPSQPSPEWPARAAAAPVADIWAASSQDVLNRPGSGVSACVSCGLPLSAAARFCRRCGSSQH